METNAFNSVNFLFAKPVYEGHYCYAIDDVNDMQIIDKDSLKNLLIKLGCGDFIKINFLFSRNFPFFFDVKKKKLLEFQETNSDITKKDLNDFFIKELNANSFKKNDKSSYEIFFGKDSNFYKQNFYKIMENKL